MKNKKNNLKKISLLSSIVVFSASLMSFPFLLNVDKKNDSLLTISENQSISNYAPSVAQNVFVDNTNDVLTTKTHSIDNNLNAAGNYSISNNFISQNSATDLTNSGYALFTSSTNTMGAKYDSITKFATKTIKNGSIDGTKDTNPGEVEWIVQLSDLVKLIDESLVANLATINFKSMLFNPGGELVTPALFALVQVTGPELYKGQYLFKINWEYNAPTTLFPNPPKPGAYALFNKISAFNTSNYNFMSLEAAATSTIQVFGFPPLIDPASPNVQRITLKVASESTAQPPADGSPPPVLDEYTYTISTSLAASTFYKARPTNLVRIGKTIYQFYQNETAVTTNANKAGFWLELPPFETTTTATRNIDLVESNFSHLDLSSYYTDGTFVNNTTLPLSIKLVPKPSATAFDFVISQTTSNAPQTSGNSTYLVASFDLGSLFLPSPSTYTFKKQTIVGSNLFFKSISNVYTSISSSTYRNYYIMDNNNRVFMTDLDFKITKSIYDFKTSSIQMGNVPLVFTMPGTSNWFALLDDSSFALFNESLLIGRWDAVSTQASYEIPIQFNILNESQIPSRVLYQEVSSGADFSSSFKSFMSTEITYQSFMKIISSDPRLGDILPSISVSLPAYSSVTSSGNVTDGFTYSVELTFSQNLRKININGEIDTSSPTKKIDLFKQSFKFINEVGSISQNIPENVPQFIKNKAPSQVTIDEIKQYLLIYKNVDDIQILTTPNDQLGTLNIQTTVPYIWLSSGSSLFLSQSQIYNFSFGTPGNPFFAFDPLVGYDASVTTVDSNYITSNPGTLEALKVKYSAIAPSSLTYDNVIDDFLILGSAFYNNSLIANGLITPLTLKDITIIPFNKEGNALIKIVFPKIGNKTNVEYLYYTPKVFFIDPTAQDIAYFVFKSNEVVVDSTIKGTSDKFGSLNPSKIAQQLNFSGDAISQIDALSYFAIFSNYFNKLLIESSTTSTQSMVINAIPNDSAGTIELSIKLLNSLPGSSINSFNYIFSGFAKNGPVIPGTATFSFNNINPELQKKNASGVTTQDLLNTGAFSFNNVANTLNYNIILEPIDTSGVLKVSVIFYNWLEAGSILPIKEFVHEYSGFVITKPPVNSIIWKSFADITANPDYSFFKTSLPTVALTQISSNPLLLSNLSKLQLFTNISSELLTYLTANDSKIIIHLIPDDKKGSMTVSLQIIGFSSPTSVYAIENTIYGFGISNVGVTYNVNFDEQSSGDVALLKNKMPSELTKDEIASLYSIDNYINTYSKTTIQTDDINGSFVLNVTIYDSYTNAQLLSANKTYVDFIKLIPPTQNFNIGLILAFILIPLVILIIPILLIFFLKNRKDVKRIAKRIDSRLTDIHRKETNKELSDNEEEEF